MLTKQGTQRLWENYLRENGKAWLNTKSGSMSPMIPAGARILVKSCHFEQVRLFDLIVFRSKAKFIVHRVLKKRKEYLLQGGDKFSIPTLIHKKCILGRVEIIETPNYIINLKKKKSFFINIIISVFYILAHKMPKYQYWILKINSKLIRLTI